MQHVKKVFVPVSSGAKRVEIFKIQGHVPWILPSTRAIGRETGGIRAGFYWNRFCIQGDWIPLERLSKFFDSPKRWAIFRPAFFVLLQQFCKRFDVTIGMLTDLFPIGQREGFLYTNGIKTGGFRALDTCEDILTHNAVFRSNAQTLRSK